MGTASWYQKQCLLHFTWMGISFLNSDYVRLIKLQLLLLGRRLKLQTTLQKTIYLTILKIYMDLSNWTNIREKYPQIFHVSKISSYSSKKQLKALKLWIIWKLYFIKRGGINDIILHLLENIASSNGTSLI